MIMKLHEDKEYFKNVVDYISEVSGIEGDVVEKDYYVCLMLGEIASKQNDIPMSFKGGTALYKISSEMRRFSEDIDLTVNTANMSGNQAKKTLEKASNKFESMPRLKGDDMEENRKGSITAVYGYDSIYPDKKDQLQRFGKIKVETTSFTVSEPVKKYQIEPLIFSYASEEQREDLKAYEMHPFLINTISLERMFVDKILAAEFYIERNNWFDVAKHLYDIHFMLGFKEIQKLLDDDDTLIRLLSYKRAEETERKGSDLDLKPLADLSIYEIIDNSNELCTAFDKMQEVYVFQNEYIVNLNDVKNSLADIRDIFNKISDKEQEYLYSQGFEDFVHKVIPDSNWEAYNIDHDEHDTR